MEQHTSASPSEDDLLTTLEVARLLRVTPETVRRMGRDSRLRGFVLSDKAGWRFRLADVRAYIDSAMNRDA